MGVLKKHNLLFCSFILLLLSSCATTTYLNYKTPQYIITVSSFGNYNLAGKSFYIESGDKSVSSKDVEFKEYANHVMTTLKLHGAYETSNKKNADMVILINYGISDESYVENVPVPIWGETGIASIKTTSHTSKNKYNSTTTSTSKVKPSYGVTGYVNEEIQVSKFCRVLNIYAYDNRQIDEAIMLWKTNLISCGSSNDLKKVIPYMAYAAWGYLGISNNGNEQFSVLENDYMFQCWKQGFLSNNNLTTYPNSSNTNTSKFIQIAFVQKLSNETIVVLRKYGCPSWYLFGADTYLDYYGQKYNLRSIDYYDIGTKIQNECGQRYFMLHFPPLPQSATTFNLKESETGWQWNGVTIR